MANISKRMKEVTEKINKKQRYEISEAVKLAKELSNVKFDESVEASFKLNLDTTKAEQQLRGGFSLPHGSGKTSKILVIAEGDAAKEAEEAGADYVGAEDYIRKIKTENWFDFDVVVATPQMMPKIGMIGPILGPKGLMPNPKTGTVTPQVGKAVAEIKAGKITYRTDKFANVHVIIGKVSFTQEQLTENYQAIYDEIIRLKPSVAKGVYLQNATISTTMGPGIKIEL